MRTRAIQKHTSTSSDCTGVNRITTKTTTTGFLLVLLMMLAATTFACAHTRGHARKISESTVQKQPHTSKPGERAEMKLSDIERQRVPTQRQKGGRLHRRRRLVVARTTCKQIYTHTYNMNQKNASQHSQVAPWVSCCTATTTTTMMMRCTCTSLHAHVHKHIM